MKTKKQRIRDNEYMRRYRQRSYVKKKIKEYTKKYNQKQEVKTKKREWANRYIQRPVHSTITGHLNQFGGYSYD